MSWLHVYYVYYLMKTFTIYSVQTCYKNKNRYSVINRLVNTYSVKYLIFICT